MKRALQSIIPCISPVTARFSSHATRICSLDFASAATAVAPATYQSPWYRGSFSCYSSFSLPCDSQGLEGLETIVAYERENVGKTRFCERWRSVGRTPGNLFSTNGEKVLVHMDSKTVRRQLAKHTRDGLTSQVYRIELRTGEWEPDSHETEGEEPDSQETEGEEASSSLPAGTRVFRALAKQAHINAVTGVVENINFQHCPVETTAISVEVPIKLVGEEDAPAVKRGAWVNLVRRTIKCICPGHSVPQQFVVDISTLDVGNKVTLDAIQDQVPPGVRLILKDTRMPVVKMSGKARRGE